MSTTLSTIAVATTAAASITSSVLSATTSNGPSPTSSISSFGGKDTRPPGPPLTPEQLAEDHRYQIYLAVAFHLLLSVVFFAVRMGSRRVTKVSLKLSDWVLLAGIVVSFAAGACFIWSAKAGAGRRFQVVAKENMALALANYSYEAMYIGSTIYFASIALIKASVLTLFYEIFYASRSYRIAVWALLGLVFAWWLSFTVVNLCICNPLSDIWDLSPNNKRRCFTGPYFMINCIVNIVTDFLIMVLPIRLVWQIQMAWRTKVAVTIIFLIGVIVIIASAFRLGYATNVHKSATRDPTWDLVVLEVWTMVELTAAVAAASMLTMRPLLEHAIPAHVRRMFGSRLRSMFSLRSRSRSGQDSPGHPQGASGQHDGAAGSAGAGGAGGGAAGTTPPRQGSSSDGEGAAGGSSGSSDVTLPSPKALEALYAGGQKDLSVTHTRVTAAGAGDEGAAEKGLGRHIVVTRDGPTTTSEARDAVEGERDRGGANSPAAASATKRWSKE